VGRSPEGADTTYRLFLGLDGGGTRTVALLATPTRADVDTITELCQDTEIQRWTTIPSPYTREDAEKFLADLSVTYRGAFLNSKYYNFPAWPGGVRGGFKAVRRAAARDQHRPLGKYTILTTIAQKYTTNVGHPGFSNAAVDEVFNKFLIPQMFAEVARGERSPDEAARVYQRQIGQIFAKWRRRGKL
jgi:hypothetical protein